MMTAKLLLSQVKLLLDKNLIENNDFEPNIELAFFNKTIASAIDLIKK